MKKLLRRLFNWVNSDSLEPCHDATSYGSKVKSMNGIGVSSLEDCNPINFRVYSAAGGKIVQIHSYDHRTDRSVSSLYIITDTENLGEELAHIITRESLTR
jgi:hypothetical protein